MQLLRPMLATAGTVPPVRERDFAFEIKWDGVRLVTYSDGKTITAYTRNDREVAATYPELAELVNVLPRGRCVLDGEVVAFNDAGVVDFGTLQRRMHIADPTVVANLMIEIPVVYVVFDLLIFDGNSWLNEPYTARRAALTELGLAAKHLQVPPAIDGNLDHAMAVSSEMRAEGIVAKRLTSTYRPGLRSPDWIKTKHVASQEVVIGGWRPGNGRRSSTIGSLLVGVPTDGGLRYAGRVGTGFTEPVLSQLRAMLIPLATTESPFDPAPPAEVRRDAHWVRPELVGEVRYAGWTGDSVMRHPAWRGLRPDKTPADVVYELG